MSIVISGAQFLEKLTLDAGTTEYISYITADSLTTGGIANWSSNSTDTGTRNLMLLVNGNALATGATVLRLQQNAAQAGLAVEANDNYAAIEVTSSLATTAVGSGININANSLTTGSLGYLSSSSASITSGSILKLDHTVANITGLFSGSVLELVQNRTLAAASTLADSADTLRITKNVTTNHASASLADSGNMIELTLVGTQTLGTLQVTGSVIDISVSGNGFTGNGIHIVNSTGAGLSLFVDSGDSRFDGAVDLNSTLFVAGVASIGNTVQATKFEDYSDSSYYLDPADATISLALAGKAGIGIAVPTSMLHVVQPVATSGTPTAFTLTGGAHTTLAASTDLTDISINLNRVVQFATGALNATIGILVTPPEIAFVGASTLTSAVTMQIDGIPNAGTNATITLAAGFVFGGAEMNVTGTSYGILAMPSAITTGIGAVTAISALAVSAVGDTVSLGNQTATLTELFGLSIDIIDYASTTNVRTVTDAASLYIEGEPTQSGNVTFTNGPFALFVDSGTSRFDGWVIEEQNSVAAANDLALTSNTVYITGATQINRIT